MKVRYKASRTILAAGSVMDIWPSGNYIEYLPKGTPQQRIGQHWQNVGNRLRKSIKAYEHMTHEG